MKTFIDEFMELGREEGREEGRKEEREKGQKIVRRFLQLNLTQQFGDVPKVLCEKIETIDNYLALEKIMDFAQKTNSLAKVQAYVDKVSTKATF